ncbi:MAG: recombination mediator RecR [bacterium]
MYTLPSSIQNMISQFAKLPGIGPKSSERMVFYLLKQDKGELSKFSYGLGHLRDKISICPTCQNFIENNYCSICNDSKRDSSSVCVVAKPQDLSVIERTNEFSGVYYILGGVLSPLNGITQDDLNIKELIIRISKNNIKEIILALNPDIEGEQTSIFLSKLIKAQNPNIKITRLARGLPMGSDLEYADEITVSDALRGRREI